MVLAAIGIYGLLNYWVRMREDEIAIRMALGAPARSILGWAAWQALRLSMAGAAIGILASWAAARWLGSLVPSITAHHLTTLAAAAVAIALMAVLAAAIPAWRAAQVDTAHQLHRC